MPEFVGDFHIHGRYAQACSKLTTIEDLERNARIKGLGVLGTGDMQHPKWFQEITSKLTEDENGILWTKNKFPFIWQTEISLAYSQGGKGRRIHHVVLAPNKEVVEQFTAALLKRGRIDYDGRPIFGMSSIDFVDMVRSISPECEIIPSHCMTPWFGLYGSKSGFDSLEECFQDRAKYIHAVETGMSADPPMLWRFSHLEKKNLVSFSDPHSSHPWRLGREATLFDCDLTYKGIIQAIRTGEGLKGTIETPPAYGKYHYDGHRLCNVVLSPAETKKVNGICPKCKSPLTIGVDYRVEEIADRPVGFKPANAKQFIDIIPLTELISTVYGIKLLSSKKIWDVYNLLIKNFGSEYNISLRVPLEELQKVIDPKLARVIVLSRENKIKILPGHDGTYGTLVLSDNELLGKQKSLAQF